MLIIDINGNKRECAKIQPDPLWPGYLNVSYYSRDDGSKTRDEWYPKADFIKNNPTLKKYTDGANDLWKEDLGTVTSASQLTLADKTKKWRTNEYAGYPIWISRGDGEGQTRTILKNTDDTLIIDKEWDTLPTKLSQYVISHNVHDPQVMGNTLPAEHKIKKVRRKVK